MSRYTEKLLATLRDRYENTDQTILSIAAEFDIGSRNLQRLATKHGWSMRSKRVHDVPRAQRLLEEAEALTLAGQKEEPPTPDPSPPLATLAEGGEQTPSAINRLEALVLKEIEAEETVRNLFRGKRRVATTSERKARTLATLTQTLHALQRLRAGALPHQETLYDDDMPEDIDAFRNELARRIDAFVASRMGEEWMAAHSAPAPREEN